MDDGLQNSQSWWLAPELQTTSHHDYGNVHSRLWASNVLPNLDMDAQLLAIRESLRYHDEAGERTKATIAELRQAVERLSGDQHHFAVEKLVDHFHQSAFEDAAKSMAAVGMLAPFIESLFRQAFLGIKAREFVKPPPTNHPRFVGRSAKKAWDCELSWEENSWKTGVAKGIWQLAEAIGLAPHFPGDGAKLLQGLFEYRNKMFHRGFEWPLKERTTFWDKVEKNWPENWFDRATTGGETWIVYMSDKFIDRCVRFADEVLEGVGEYCRERRVKPFNNAT